MIPHFYVEKNVMILHFYMATSGILLHFYEVMNGILVHFYIVTRGIATLSRNNKWNNATFMKNICKYEGLHIYET